jgi:ribosome maturation protein Sdo1
MNAVQLLDRILDPITDAFTPEVAQRIVALKVDAEMQGRVDELAAKSNDGSLTDEEQAEYKNYVHVIDLISVLQAKSQRVLNSAQ